LIIPPNAFMYFFENQKKSPKALNLYNTHTGESLKKITFFDGHVYDLEALCEIEKFFRDHRNNMSHAVDIELVEFLYQLSATFDEKTIHLVSGFRSTETNEMLRNCSTGVAKKSLHLVGKAADIFIEGVSNTNLAKLAKSCKSGGVGLYNGFVHIDTGRVRSW
jgi:uncharacterized protein YcbK (DUF882 family)